MTMNYYKATIQYNGTNYFGFQWQKDIHTIQNDLNEALYKLLEGKVTTMGASRTDRGVHACEQIVKITSEDRIDCESFLKELNQKLSVQIRCSSLVPCEGEFKPSVDSLSKEYRYLFTNTLNSRCADQIFIANNPHELDIELMKSCIPLIVGQHDFHRFYSMGSNVKSTVRNITNCEFSVVDPHIVLSASKLFPLPNELRQCFEFKIEGNGFLKQMVRHLVSALWLVGRRKISLEEFSLLINSPVKGEQLWKAAPSRGLYLYRIHY